MYRSPFVLKALTSCASHATELSPNGNIFPVEVVKLCGQSEVARFLFLDSYREAEVGLLDEVGEAEIILSA